MAAHSRDEAGINDDLFDLRSSFRVTETTCNPSPFQEAHPSEKPIVLRVEQALS